MTTAQNLNLPQIDLASLVATGELEACGRMAYRFAHEMGNATAAVVGNAELISRGVEETSPIYRRASNIVRAMNQVAGLARRMELCLGHSAHDDRPLNLLELCGEAQIESLCKTLPRPLTVSVSLPAALENLPQPYVSHSRLQIALAALLANAADATVDRVAAAALTVAVCELAAADLAALLRSPHMTPGSYLAISVSDAGEGIAAEHLPHIFSPAFSTRMRQTGCGLSDVYGTICRQHGGGIALRTAPGRGTEVTLYIPAARPRPASL